MNPRGTGIFDRVVPRPVSPDERQAKVAWYRNRLLAFPMCMIFLITFLAACGSQAPIEVSITGCAWGPHPRFSGEKWLNIDLSLRNKADFSQSISYAFQDSGGKTHKAGIHVLSPGEKTSHPLNSDKFPFASSDVKLMVTQVGYGTQDINLKSCSKPTSIVASDAAVESDAAKIAVFYGKWRLTRYAPEGKPWEKPDWGDEVIEIMQGGRYELNGKQGRRSLNAADGSLSLVSGIRSNTLRRDGDSIQLTDRNGGRYTYVPIEK